MKVWTASCSCGWESDAYKKHFPALDESIDHRVAASRRDPDADHEVAFSYDEVSDDAD